MRRNFSLLWIFCFLTLISNAYAVNYDIHEKTPAVQQALASRKARYETIQNQKSQGLIGEDSQGYVQSFGQSPEAAGVVSAENSDRQVIYEAIVSQNNLGPTGMNQVQAAFAEVQREKARPGDPIQLPSGKWTKK